MSISIHRAISVPEGDGISVKRLMPVDNLRNFDPFVLWDHFDISNGGFPDHPHRGFEAITYLFDGAMQHADDFGNQGIIHAGGAQRFTAGRGMVHSEFPAPRAHGIQLWINLPQRLKSLAPDYQQLQAGMIPENIQNGIIIRIIVGQAGAIALHSDVEYLDIQMPPDARLQRQVLAGQRGFIYAVQGSVSINGIALQAGQAAMIEQLASINMHSTQAARLMWCFGQAHAEAIHQHGSFVD